MKTAPRTLLALALVAGMAFRCQHDHDEEPVITQTITKTVTAGQTFTVALPGDEDDVYAITTPAAHAAASSVKGSAYTYRATNAPVADQIVLTATEQHKGKGHHGGSCGSNGSGNTETTAVITIKVVVAHDTTTPETRTGG